MVNILGHRGARGEWLENSAVGFCHTHALIHQGLAGIEFDVQLTQDGHLCVFHDETLQRLCQRQSYIQMMTKSELDLVKQSTNGRNQQAMIFLSQMLPYLFGFSHIELEIKTHERSHHGRLIEALLSHFVRYDLFQLPIILTSFDQEVLARLQNNRRLNVIPRGLLVEKSTLSLTVEQTIQQALRLGCNQIGWEYFLLNDAVIQQCHRYDLAVTAWTVNEVSIAKQLIKEGVDTLITDFPTRMLLAGF